MKKLLFALLFCACVSVQAQRHNAMYLTFSPMDRGVGVRYDHKSIYGAVSYGKYEQLNGCHINTHFKLSGGYVKHLPISLQGYQYNWLVGASYHVYRGISEDITRSYLFPVSLEIGAGVRKNRFLFGLRVDTKHNATMDFGLKF
jgi:hypothetical protein